MPENISSCDIFYASIDYRSFACSLTRPRAEAKKGYSPFGGKIRVQNEVLAGACGGKYFILCLEIFQPKGKK